MTTVQQLLADYDAFRKLYESAREASPERFPSLPWPDLEPVSVAVERRMVTSLDEFEAAIRNWVAKGEGWLRRRSALVATGNGREEVIRGDAADPGPVLYGELADGNRSLEIRHLRGDHWRIETTEEGAGGGDAVLARTVRHFGWNGGLRYRVYFHLLDGETRPFGFRFLGFGD